ncbi:ABC transporter substrate-binding protein [Prodigiosinella confusarubida]|uniref:ABC transporter substrate-binding protein n=1 Tax=Serratia sp. (strain ATCC 39006) TaxID=104623 RepID=A0A2I5T400_SERS3|nr:ABC transporter substrate-binding protein [Serratia sp. ATCC 39006]AUG99283.1 ABC transporter substrate-binding protein [Serratia sp. ATCC 39006]AUH03601.1 ABC transporter substrate-binding protein [Serratia sp. ATCC 39006]
MTIRTVFIGLLTSLALIQSASAIGAAIPQQIRFGTDPTFPPFEYKTPQGELAGFDIDLGNALCSELKVKCVWVENSFDGLIPALQAKKFDAILSSLSITAERQKAIAFSDKLFNTPAYLVIGKNSGLKPTIESLKGKRLGVQQGSVFEAYANKHWRNAGVEIVTYPDAESVYADLTLGRLDATLDDATVVTAALLNKPQGKNFMLAEPQVKDPAIFGPGTGIGLRKADTQLQARLNSAIAAIRANGTYDQLAKKYFNFNVYGE